MQANTPPRIDVASLLPQQRVVEYPSIAMCPDSKADPKFSGIKVFDEDASVYCGDSTRNAQDFAVRFFVSTLPPLGQPFDPSTKIEFQRELTASEKCDFVFTNADFVFNRQTFSSSDWYIVEMVASDGFNVNTTTFRDAKPGYGVDSFIWLARAKAVPCP